MEKSLGSNITSSVTKDVLTLKIDLKQRLGRSRSGKTELVATTSGNKVVDGSNVVIGINAYVKD